MRRKTAFTFLIPLRCAGPTLSAAHFTYPLSCNRLQDYSVLQGIGNGLLQYMALADRNCLVTGGRLATLQNPEADRFFRVVDDSCIHPHREHHRIMGSGGHRLAERGSEGMIGVFVGSIAESTIGGAAPHAPQHPALEAKTASVIAIAVNAVDGYFFPSRWLGHRHAAGSGRVQRNSRSMLTAAERYLRSISAFISRSIRVPRVLDHAHRHTSVMIHNPSFRRTLIGPHETDAPSLSSDKASRRGRFPP